MTTPFQNGVTDTTVSVSGNYKVDDLLAGAKWGGPVGQAARLDYSFPGPGSTWAVGYGDAEPSVGLAALNAAQQQGVKLALDAWANVANLQFTLVTESPSKVGDIRLAWTGIAGIKDSQAYTYGPSGSPEAADVWLNPDAPWDGYTPGKYGNVTFIHELGHALGLSHSFEGSISGVLPIAEDSYSNTVMSYSALVGFSGSDVNFYPTTPMGYDIGVMQYLYGVNTTSHSGNDTYTFNQGQAYFQTIWDAGGSDTIVWNATNQGATIDLRPGAWSTLGNPLTFSDSSGKFLRTVANTVQIFDTVTIENATGGNANDVIIGNSAANFLQGGGGNDTLSGGDGNDMLMGGPGNDVLDGGSGIDTALFSGARSSYQLQFPAGTLNVVSSAGNDGVDTLSNVERLQFSDQRLALDLASTQSGGKAALLMAAAAGPGVLGNQALVSSFLGYFDVGNSLDAGAQFLVSAGIMATLAGSPSNSALVNLLYFNLVGVAPDAATASALTAVLDNGSYSQSQFLAVAAASSINQDHINLVGLASSGLAFALP